MSAPGTADVPLGKNMKRAGDALGPPTSPSANRRPAGEDASAPRGMVASDALGPPTSPSANRRPAGEDASAPRGVDASDALGPPTSPSANRRPAGEDASAPRGMVASDALGPPTSPSANRRPAGEDASAPRGEDARAPRGWYSRGYLPHCDAPQLIQSVTYRLADSLPQARLASLREELEHLPEKQREIERRKRIESWLDAGLGCCALAHPEVAQYVQNSFLHFHGVRYHLHAWCIMPNHVHVLIEPLTDLAAIVRGWKSFTARWILARNASLGLKIPSPDQLWMREYWDRYIRDARHYERTVAYIHENPVKAGLCSDATAWPWSSAYPGNAGVPAGKTSSDAEEYPLGTPMSPSANLKTAGEDAGDPRSFR